MRAHWLIALFVLAGTAGCFGPPDDGTLQYGDTVHLGLELRDATSGRVVLPMQEDLSGPVVLRRGADPFGLPGVSRAIVGAMPEDSVDVRVRPVPMYEEVRVSRWLPDLDATQEVRRSEMSGRIDPLEEQNLQPGLRLRWSGGYRYEVDTVSGDGPNATVVLRFVGDEQTQPLFAIAANVTGIVEGAKVRQRVEPLADGLWVKVDSPFAPPTPLQVPQGIYRHKGVSGDDLVMARVDLDLGLLGHLFDAPLDVTVQVESVEAGVADPYARPAERLANHGARDSPHLA